MSGGICSCGRGLGPKNKSGKCRPCLFTEMNKDPAFVAKRAEANKAAHRTSYRKRINIQLARQLNATIWRTEDGYAKRVELGHRNYANIDKPEVREKCRIARAEAMRVRWEKAFSWCPPQYRAEYNRLVRSKRIKAAEAKRIVLELIERDTTPPTFEERLGRALQGKAIIVPALTRHHLTPRIGA